MAQPDMKVLWARSGNRCAVCFIALTQDLTKATPIGEQAHIKGEHSGQGSIKQSARYDENQSNSERNSYANYILLCPTCHTTIDKDEITYTVDRLLSIKNLHERKISEAIKSCALNVTFYELEHTLRHLINNLDTSATNDLTLIPPRDKIAKNNLGNGVEGLIRAGLIGARQVEDFLNQNADMDYSEKLRKAFVDSYKRLREEDLSGDRLFFALLNVASNNSSDSQYMAAGLNVLVYYFQLCEVFEK